MRWDERGNMRWEEMRGDEKDTKRKIWDIWEKINRVKIDEKNIRILEMVCQMKTVLWNIINNEIYYVKRDEMKWDRIIRY